MVSRLSKSGSAGRTSLCCTHSIPEASTWLDGFVGYQTPMTVSVVRKTQCTLKSRLGKLATRNLPTGNSLIFPKPLNRLPG